MPEGQFTGERKAYLYENDNGTKYVMQLDGTLGDLTGSNLEDYTGQDGAQPKPTRFEPRGVYWQGKLGDRQVRKFIVCNASGSTLYESDTSQELTIDGVAGYTTGRRGEQLSFIRAQDGGDGGAGA